MQLEQASQGIKSISKQRKNKKHKQPQMTLKSTNNSISRAMKTDIHNQRKAAKREAKARGR
jgi:hypothetical protein